jgi:hypothetical protein
MTSDTIREKAASTPDPIFLVVERHRRAAAAYDTAIAAREADDDGAIKAERRAYWGLVETVQTTLAGIGVLCDHRGRYAKRNEQWAEVRDGEFGVRLLANIRDALAQIGRGDG